MNLFFRNANFSIYEIYPESETPHLTEIANFYTDLNNVPQPLTYLLPGTVIWYEFYEDRIVFIVWDYQLNHSTSFSVDIDVDFGLKVYFIFSNVLKLAPNSFVGR